MRPLLKPAFIALSILAAHGPALAQSTMPGMSHPMGDAPADSMMSSMDKMSKDMAAVPMTGNADRDFAAMMIPHHQGAIDMARYELAHGKDPALRKLANEIIAAQRKEIARLQQWLAKHPAR